MSSFIIMIIATIVFALAAALCAAVWVYKDAKQRDLQAVMWVFIVVLTGIFIGLVLYLLIGREKGAEPKQKVKNNKGLIFASIISIVLTFVFVGAGIYFYVNADGFTFEKNYSLYSSDLIGSAQNVEQNSSGDVWEFSYDNASGGYSLSKTYNTSAVLESLLVDLQCTGSVQLVVTQDGVFINETIGKGSYLYDMADFEAGKITMRLINLDAADLSGKITITQ